MDDKNQPAPGAPAGGDALQNSADDVAATAADLVKKSMATIQPDAIDQDEYIEMIAEVCHEVNRAYCQGMGDDSQLPWDQAPPVIRESAKQGVIVHIQSFLSPEQSHAVWKIQKEQAGYVFGSVKDDVLKTHPCIVPYAQLPLDQRMKDRLFIAVVKALSKDVG